MSRPLHPAHLLLQQKLRRKVEETPAPTVDGTPVMWWGTIDTVNTGPPPTLDVAMSTGVVIPGLRRDLNMTVAAGSLVWGLAVDGDYFVCGVRA